jgi:copper chaperone CopZ
MHTQGGYIPIEEVAMSDIVTMQVDGMSCGHCVAAVERALEATPGVAGVSVKVGRASMAVAGTEARDRVIAAALAAIGDAGFTATLDEQPAPKHEGASGCCCGSGHAPSTITLGRVAR